MAPSWYIAGNERLQGAAFPASASATTWDPSTISGGGSLSPGNLAFTSSGLSSVMSFATISGTQKIYAEFVMTSAIFASDTIGFGILNPSTWTSGNQFINNPNSAGVKESNNFVNYNGTGALLDVGSCVQGDVISIAVDFGNSKIWARRNGITWNNDILANQNPATNTGGLSFIGLGSPVKFGCEIDQGNPDTCTARFSSSSWSFTAPAGFVQLQ